MICLTAPRTPADGDRCGGISKVLAVQSPPIVRRTISPASSPAELKVLASDLTNSVVTSHSRQCFSLLSFGRLARFFVSTKTRNLLVSESRKASVRTLRRPELLLQIGIGSPELQ